MDNIFDAILDVADQENPNPFAGETCSGPDGDSPGGEDLGTNWLFTLPCLLLPPLLTLRTYQLQAWDSTWRLVPMYSTALLALLTLVVAYYTQTTNATLCALPPSENADYVQLYCGGHAYQYVSWLRQRYHQQQNSREFKIKVFVTWYSYFPLAFGCAAMICYVPQMVWIFLNQFGATQLNITETVRALRAGDRKACMDKFALLKRASVWSKLIFCKCLSLAIAGALGFLCYWALFLSKRPLFPKEVLCDYIKGSGNQYQNNIIPCVLPVNLFNEQVCILVGFWFAFVCVAHVISILAWCLSVTGGVIKCMAQEVEGLLPASILHSDMSYSQLMSLTLVYEQSGHDLGSKYLRLISDSYCARHNIRIGGGEGEPGMNGHHQEQHEEPEQPPDDEAEEAV